MREATGYRGQAPKIFLNDIIKNGKKEKQKIQVVSIANAPKFMEYVISNNRRENSKSVPEIATKFDKGFF